MAVLVKCPKCGSEEKSMIQTSSEEGLKGIIAMRNIQRCSKCGSGIPVDNRTMYWK